jgi:NAD(P)-dependent dehydrogenase (short-subunit alcohol dehydrogenase family)
MSGTELSSKTALVTGAGRERGIGRAIAVALVERGANVVMTDLAGTETLQSVRSQFGSNASKVSFFDADVTCLADGEAAVSHAVTEFGGLDILVNNAGVGRGSPDFLELTEEDWNMSLNVNLRGVVNFCQAAVPELRKSDAAAIINVASLSGLKAIPLIPACYTASKFAVVGLTKQLALQLAPEHIRVNAICPGSVRTDMMQTVMEDIAAAEGISVEDAEAHEAATIALGRAAEPSEIGQVAAYLAGPSGSYVTGEALAVSGGMFNGL